MPAPLNTMFINLEYFRQNTPVNHNVDGEFLQPIIVNSQYLHLLPIMGTALYNRVSNDIDADILSGTYKTLTDYYIQPATKEWALYEALPFINFHLTNKNVAKKDSDNSTAANLDELNMLVERTRNNAEYYSTRLSRYLLANTDIFPEYLSGSSRMDTIIPTAEDYFSGIHVPGAVGGGMMCSRMWPYGIYAELLTNYQR